MERDTNTKQPDYWAWISVSGALLVLVAVLVLCDRAAQPEPVLDAQPAESAALHSVAMAAADYVAIR